MSELKDKDVFVAMLAWLGIFDLGLTVLLLFFWLAVVQVADPSTTVVLMIVRAAVWIVALWLALAPVRRWYGSAREHSHSHELDHAKLIQADHALARIDWRFTLIYIAAWELSMMLSVLLGQLGVPIHVVVGKAELATAVVMLISLASCGLLMRELVRAVLLPRLRDVAARVFARDRTIARTRSSVGNGMHATIVAIVMACLPGLVMVMGLVHIVGVRAETSLDQLRQAELAALHLDHGGAGENSLDSNLRVVEAAQLPSPLRALLDTDARSLRGFDRETNEAVAAVVREDGRWLLARVQIDDRLGLILAGVAGISIVGVVLGLLVSMALWRSQRELLDGLDDATRRVAVHGELHALARLVPLRNDELGRVASNFNAMLDMLDELAGAASSVACGDLQVRLDHPGDLHDAFRGMLAQLNLVVMQLRETAVELATTAREIQAATQEQELAGQRQSWSVAEVGISLTTLANAAVDIANQAHGVLGNAEQTLDATDTMAEKFTLLHRQARGIGELLVQIQEIADRSDLLALNGSLEACRAGESGRGFALVASEMRRLAERVTELVAGVRVRITDIEASGSSTIVITERSHALAHDTATAARHISTVIQQQSVETEQVARTVDDVTQAAMASSAAVTQTRAAAEGLTLQAGRLEQLLAHFELESSPALAREGSGCGRGRGPQMVATKLLTRRGTAGRPA